MLPGNADVVVIGGGVIGASISYYLTRRQLKVVMLEQGICRIRYRSHDGGYPAHCPQRFFNFAGSQMIENYAGFCRFAALHPGRPAHPRPH